MKTLSGYLSQLSPRSLGWVAFSISLACVLLVFFIFYNQVHALFEKNLRSEISQLAQTAANLIDPEPHNALRSPEQTGNAIYQEAIRPLQVMCHSFPEIHSLHTMVERDGRLFIILEAIRQPGSHEAAGIMPTPVMSPIAETHHYEAYLQSAEASTATVLDHYHWHNEMPYLEAISAIVDQNGETIGYLALDFSMSAFNRHFLPLHVTGACILFMSIGICLFFGNIAKNIRIRTTNVIRDKERAETALKEALSDAESARDAKTEFLAIAAHDIKNPLSAIKGLCQMQEIALTQSPEAERWSRVYDFNQRMSLTSSSLIRLVEEILATSTLERSGISIEDRPFSLSRIIRESMNLNRPSASRKEIRIQHEGEDVWVKGDRMRLFEACDNLINNAVKYSFPGSEIAIRVARIENNRVRLSVCDQGPGLTVEDKAQLFQQFQRLSAKPTGGESSTGLGLSIVKRIVDAHKGRVWCESEPGQGACFFIEIDCTDTPPDSEAATEADRFGELVQFGTV